MCVSESFKDERVYACVCGSVNLREKKVSVCLWKCDFCERKDECVSGSVSFEKDRVRVCEF